MGEQDIHDLRGEVGGLRADIRALSGEVKAGFSQLDGRVRRTEDAVLEARAREDERAKLLVQGQGQIMQQAARPPMYRDPRTYTAGVIGTAIGSFLLEIVRTLASGPK